MPTDRLAISLWDFSWYTRATDAYADLDDAVAQAVARGYNALRICAAPLLLAGGHGLPEELGVTSLGAWPGGRRGAGTRWYDVPRDATVHLRRRLFALLEAAARHGVRVILASWEHQQSPAFSADERWWRAIDAVPHEDRLRDLAGAFTALLADIRAAGLLDAVAFVELHNEVDFSRVPGDAHAIDEAIGLVSREHPDVPVTVSYGKPPHRDIASLPGSLQVGQFHVYAYGVLDALQRRIDVRGTGTDGFPNAALRALLRDDAPTLAEYGRPEAWRLEATVVTDQMLYTYDAVDPARWDRWLHEHYGEHRDAMHDAIRARVRAIGAWARARDVPFVVGEGWVGYTPLRSTFEDGPVGQELAETGIAEAVDQGAWGAVPTSNAAPHHPLWGDVAWQRRATAMIRSA
ncbi:cellulase-like family protein [Demequina soli]|uniref:cellulase-like family protein n=1 Tax=Demequina soli TaxID=1638987 RepID=UPI0007815011|nr:cellulase-like family protein [Demequina soli]